MQAVNAELDRLSELTAIGAGHAATAFSQLVGTTIRMGVPIVVTAGSDASGSRQQLKPLERVNRDEGLLW